MHMLQPSIKQGPLRWLIQTRNGRTDVEFGQRLGSLKHPPLHHPHDVFPRLFLPERSGPMNIWHVGSEQRAKYGRSVEQSLYCCIYLKYREVIGPKVKWVEDDGGKFIDLVHAARGNAGNACELLFRACLLARAENISNTNLSTDGSVQKWIKSSYWMSHWIEEHRLTAFGNWVLGRCFGTKRDEETGRWRRMSNEEFRVIYIYIYIYICTYVLCIYMCVYIYI